MGAVYYESRSNPCALALTARFDYTSSAARGTGTAPFALWAGRLGRGLSKTSVRQGFSSAVAQLTVAITNGVTIRAGLSGHTALPGGLILFPFLCAVNSENVGQYFSLILPDRCGANMHNVAHVGKLNG
jgi:hypothetical protein